jgi:hypothetical protein
MTDFGHAIFESIVDQKTLNGICKKVGICKEWTKYDFL